MSEVYSTPVHDSTEPQEVSRDILAQEEMDGMQSRLSALADAGTVADHVVVSFVAALPDLPADDDVLKCSVAALGSIAMNARPMYALSRTIVHVCPLKITLYGNMCMPEH